MCGRYKLTDDPPVRRLIAALGMSPYKGDDPLDLAPTVFVPIASTIEQRNRTPGQIFSLCKSCVARC